MKKLCCLLAVLLWILAFAGCGSGNTQVQIVATTLPVYEFTEALCQGTGLTVGQLVTESVSCLHDYTLQVNQMRMIEQADMIVISGAGLEDFLDDALASSAAVIDASEAAHVHSADSDHDHDHGHENGHSHEQDPHIWLSPENAKIMARNICAGLSGQYPEHGARFEENLGQLLVRLDRLQAYGEEALASLSCRELITFHDGFAYFAESFDLTILRAIEEESGSEASAAELKELIRLVKDNSLPAVFIEANAGASAAQIVAAETGAEVFILDMAISAESYFDAMYHNIDTIKEALG